MKKLTVLALSLAIVGLGSTQVHAAPKKTTKTTTTKTATKPAATTSSTPSIESLAAGNTNLQSPQMRGEITTTITHVDAANLLTTPVQGLPTPTTTVSDVQNVPTVHTPANQAGSILLDTTLIDEFITVVSPNARHYPTSFPTVTYEYLAKQNTKHLSDWIEPYANAPDASYDIVLRAAKLNGIARNLNLGTDYSVRASKHTQKAVKLKPNDAEANFLLGMMMSESGGFDEGKKYLEKAASLGYTEAEQSLAQADLLNDNKALALSRLQKLQADNPTDPQIARQIRIVEEGGYYIWQNDDKQPLDIKAVE